MEQQGDLQDQVSKELLAVRRCSLNRVDDRDKRGRQKHATPLLDTAAAMLVGHEQALTRTAMLAALLRREFERVEAHQYRQWLPVSFGLLEHLQGMHPTKLREEAAKLAGKSANDFGRTGGDEQQSINALAAQIVADCPELCTKLSPSTLGSMVGHNEVADGSSQEQIAHETNSVRALRAARFGLTKLADCVAAGGEQLRAVYRYYNEKHPVPILRWGLYLLVAFIVGDLLLHVLRAYVVNTLPVPASGFLRDVFELLAISNGVYDNYWLLLALFASLVLVVIAMMRSGKRHLRGWAWVIFIYFFATLSIFSWGCSMAVNADVNATADMSRRVAYWERVYGENFADSSHCADLRSEERSALRGGCQIESGALLLSVDRDQKNAVSDYRAVGSPLNAHVELPADFFVETRFRSRGAEWTACALGINEPDRNYHAYFKLVARPTDRYPGYGAELLGRDGLSSSALEGHSQAQQAYAETSETLPYVRYRRPNDEIPVEDDEYEDGEGWVTLTVVRIDNAYELFVNRRPAFRFVSDRVATAQVALSVISGAQSPGNLATCEFDYFVVSVAP